MKMVWNEFAGNLRQKFIGAFNLSVVHLNFGGAREIIANLIASFKFHLSHHENQEKIVKSIKLVRASNFFMDGQKSYPNLPQDLCKKVIEEIKHSAHSYRIQDFNSNTFKKVADINKIPEGVNSFVIEPDISKKYTKELLQNAISNIGNDLLGYFGCKPSLDNVNVLYSTPGKAIGPQYFHRDWDSLKFIKLFIYLNDVTMNNGPHQFVLGSQMESIIVNRDRYSDSDIYGNYDKDKIKTMLGNAGSNFLEDTRGIHRGLELIGGERWLLSARFTLVPTIFRERDGDRRMDLNKLFN